MTAFQAVGCQIDSRPVRRPLEYATIVIWLMLMLNDGNRRRMNLETILVCWNHSRPVAFCRPRVSPEKRRKKTMLLELCGFSTVVFVGRIARMFPRRFHFLGSLAVNGLRIGRLSLPTLCEYRDYVFSKFEMSTVRGPHEPIQDQIPFFFIIFKSEYFPLARGPRVCAPTLASLASCELFPCELFPCVSGLLYHSPCQFPHDMSSTLVSQAFQKKSFNL